MEFESIIQPGVPLISNGIPLPLDWSLDMPSRPCEGGMYSDTYRVPFEMDGRAQTLCVKVLRTTADEPINGLTSDERLRLRIAREMRIWEQTKHPNIHPFYGYMVFEQTTWLISPWAENGNLASYLEENPSLTYRDRIKLALDVARGVEYLHNFTPPILHGDINPRNVLINMYSGAPTGTLSDFGVARLMLLAGVHTGLTTTTGNTSGNVAFISPEILMADSPLAETLSSDVYSLGGIILLTMSDKAPFYNRHASIAVIMRVVFKGERPNPADHPGLPENNPIWPILKQCWDPEPMKRPTSRNIAEILEALLLQAEGA